MRISSFAGLLFLAAAAGCSGASANPEIAPGSAPQSIAETPPTLIVFITVDQLRGDFIDKYRRDLRHGLARLTKGAWFTNAYQDHGLTETAPGHASTMSGRFPRSTGIVSNSEGVLDRDAPLLIGGPREAGASPLLFRGTTLYDWLLARDARARAVSVSFKDRSAILPIGHARQDVYWYSTVGAFTTSTYYRDTLPSWVQAFNARRIPHQYAGRTWELALPESRYPAADSMSFENGGEDFTFPHQIPADTAAATAYIRYTPTGDSLTALFALEGLRATGIGRGPQTDILAVSFSSTDRIGHEYGPDSREHHDNMVRLDRTLGWFIDSVYAMRDSARIVIALTADHGVHSNRQLARARGWAKENEGHLVSLRQVVADVQAGLKGAGMDPSAFYYDRELLGLIRPAFARAKVNADSVIDDFARRARQVPGVLRVDRIADLRRADHRADPIARRWTHQIPVDSPMEVAITLTRFSVWYDAVATHGSPHDLDAHVPVIFYGPRIKPGRYAQFARVVDMAPTLAALAGARPTETLDGVVLTSALR